MATPLDKCIVAKCLKEKADALYKQYELQAYDELAELNESYGATEIASKLFDGAKYRYSKTRAKKIVDFNRTDDDALVEWLADNPEAATTYAALNAEAFGEWWFESTGEVPDGIARVEYTQEAKVGAPKLYGYDSETAERVIRDNNLLAGVEPLLLGEGEWSQ